MWNGIGAEVLANTIGLAATDLHKLEYPLQSSLMALGTSQWLSADILPKWERINEKKTPTNCTCIWHCPE